MPLLAAPLPRLLLLAAGCLPRILGAAWDAAAPAHVVGAAEGAVPPGPPLRIRRAAGRLRGSAHLRLALETPPPIDAYQAQELLRTVSLPRNVPGTGSTITGLAMTTECDPPAQGSRNCRCLPGHLWSDRHCTLLPACGGLFGAFLSLAFPPPCECLRLPATSAIHCVPLLDASPVSRRPALPPARAPAGTALRLSFPVGDGAELVALYLLGPDASGAAEIRNGTGATLLRDGAEVALLLSRVSPAWAGRYICRYRRGETLWEVAQELTVPLGPADVAPAGASVDCSPGDAPTLWCCVRNRAGPLQASWHPGAPDPVVLSGEADPLCHSLALAACPSADTTYWCTFEGDGLGTVETPVLVSVIRAGELFCPGEDAQGWWGATKAGRVAERPCPEGSGGTMLRRCSPGGAWGDVQAACTSQRLLSWLHKAQLLRAGLGNPQVEVPQMLSWLKREARPTEGQVCAPCNLHALIATMGLLSHVALDAHMRLDSSAVTNLLAAVDQMLGLDPEAEWSALQARWPRGPSDFLLAVESLSSLLAPGPGGFRVALPRLELQSDQLDTGAAGDYSKAFATEPPVSLHIAAEALQALLREARNLTVTSLVLWNLGAILPGPGGHGAGAALGSLVLSVAVTTPDGGVSGVQSDMTFGHWNTTPHEGGECVFWNHSLRGGEGGWSPQGCQTSGAGNATSCSCQHLTSFSVLMSAHPVPASAALTALSRLGLCASALALAAALLIYYLVWRLVVRNKVAYFRYTTLANIAASLLMGSLWLLGAFAMPASHENGLCVAAAFFTHFFYLATFFWMLVQALTLFHQLVFVFHRLTISTVTPAMVAVGYGCPLAVAVATVAAFLPRRSYLQASFCWLSAPSRAIHAFSGPVLAIVVVNALVLFVVLLKLMRPLGPEGAPGEERKALLGIFKALLILTPVFGLTWVLGVITMTTDASTFTHYAFSILNSFQGVFILLFGCLMDRKVRAALRTRLFRPSGATGTSTTQTEAP